MTKAAVIQPNGSVSIQEMNGYDDLKNALNGGYLEGITLTEDSMAYIDEEGKLKGLPSNEKATALMKELIHKDGRVMLPGDYISGTMIIVGTLDEKGQHDADDHDAPKHILEHFYIKKRS